MREDFAELALPLLDSLYNCARWLTRDRAEAEDLVQETFAKALKGYAAFQSGGSFRAWMFRILRNTFLNSRAGRAVRTVALGDEEDGPLPPAATTQETPEAIYFAQADRETIQAAIAALPVALREAILLADVEDFSYREMSEALAIPLGTVMSRLARARARLRQALAGQLARVPS